MQKSTFLAEKISFWVTLYRIEMQAVTDWSSQLRKHKTFEILRTADFLRSF